MIDRAGIKSRFETLAPHLDERARRLFAATEARAAGRGGISAQPNSLIRLSSDANEAMKAAAKTSEVAKRLQTVPGVGIQTAMAIEAFAPDMTCFNRGRDFSAWLGLVPRQHSTGGKSRLGKISKMGQADIRSQLIRGAMSVITAATRFGIAKGSWLERLLARKPKLVAAVTLANRMARAIWAMLTHNENYRNPEAA